MNKDIIKGNWKEIKGKLKQQWGEITDDDLMKLQGGRDELEGLLQTRYGYAKDEVKKQIDGFIDHNKWQ